MNINFRWSASSLFLDSDLCCVAVNIDFVHLLWDLRRNLNSICIRSKIHSNVIFVIIIGLKYMFLYCSC